MTSSRKAVRAGLRKAGAATGLAAAVLLTAAATMTPAQAAPAPKPLAAPAPTTSPTVKREYISGGGTTSCPRQYACAGVPYGSGWYAFKFIRYDTYYLSYWSGAGNAFNNQTGGAAMRLYDGNGHQVKCIPAGKAQDVKWKPIWSIRLTSSGC